MWAKQPKRQSFSLCDPWAGHRGAGVAKAVSGPLGCSEGRLLNWGQVTVLGEQMGGAKAKGDAGELESRRKADSQERHIEPGLLLHSESLGGGRRQKSQAQAAAATRQATGGSKQGHRWSRLKT